MSLTAYPTLFAKLHSKKYRDAFCISGVRHRIALQIRALRKDIFGSQQALADAMGKPANVISRLESPAYGKLTLQTLHELASAFDVGLIIHFARFSDVVKHVSDLSEHALIVPNFESEIEEDDVIKKLELATSQPAETDDYQKIDSERKRTPTMTDWQDIESAPRDCDILLWCPIRGVVVGHWNAEQFTSNPKPYWTHDREWLWGKKACRLDQPTNWMPLPPPPKVKA